MADQTPGNKMKVFIVDDDEMQTNMLQDHLSKFSMFDFASFPTGEACLDKLNDNPDVIILDYYLDSRDKEALDGIDILKEIKKQKPKTEVIMLSGQDKIDVAINTMKWGAFDYVVKGDTAFHRLENVIYNLIRKRKLTKSLSLYKTLFVLSAAAFTIMIIVVIFLYWKGMIQDSPGWL